MLVKNHLFKNRVPIMSAALDAYALRQKTIAKNIANVNTPHYQPEEVRFEAEFHKQQDSLKGTETSGMHNSLGFKSGSKIESEVQVSPIPDAEVYMAGDSHVNIDKEMGELARNQIRTRFASQMLSRYFRGLGSAITGQASQN